MFLLIQLTVDNLPRSITRNIRLSSLIVKNIEFIRSISKYGDLDNDLVEIFLFLFLGKGW